MADSATGKVRQLTARHELILDIGSEIFESPEIKDVTVEDGTKRPTVTKALKDALANYGMFSSVDEGLASVEELGAFTVLGEPSGDATTSGSNQEPFLTGYRKINGEAVKIGTLPSGTLINLFTMFFAWDELVDPDKIPVFIDRNGRVSVAIIDGKIWVTDFTGPATARMLQQAELANNSRVPIAVDGSGRVGLAMIDDALWAQNLTGPVEARLLKTGEFLDGYTPIIVDKNNNVPLWVHHDELWWMGRNISTPDAVPVAVTDGASLSQYRRKQTFLEQKKDAVLRVMISGDSWTERKDIPQAFADALYSKYGQSGEGWIQLNVPYVASLNNVVLNKSKDWKHYDASTTTKPPQYGTAHDGMCIYTAETTSTIELNGVEGNALYIYYRNVDDGAFRYQLDGGDWVEVADQSDTHSKITLDGLAEGTHSLNIDTTINAGTVVIYGFRSTSSKSGIEIQKSGNGGIDGSQWPKVMDQIGYYSKELAPDLLLFILGTNDYRLKKGTGTFSDGLERVIKEHVAANPALEVVVIYPAKCKPDVEPPESDYRDAARKIATENGWEFISWFDFFPSVYDKSNGMWDDDLHLNSIGAAYAVKLTLNKLMGVY